MTPAQVQTLLVTLCAAYPLSTKAKAPGTLDVLRSFLARLDRDLAERAVRDVIATKTVWPSVAEIAKAYDARAAESRRRLADEQARRERDAVEIEPTEAERRRTLERARAYAAQRWGS